VCAKVIAVRDQILHEFDFSKVREEGGWLTYESRIFQTADLKQLVDCLREKFQEAVEGATGQGLEYQISVKTTPVFCIEENTTKTLVVYSNGTVWLHLIRDVEEANRILKFISARITNVERKDLQKLCGEGGLSRWSCIKRETKVKPEEFEARIRELIEIRHYTGVETRSILSSFGVKYREQRTLEILPVSDGVSVHIAMKDLFCQSIDLLKVATNFLSI
jgi:hypothetical protein